MLTIREKDQSHLHMDSVQKTTNTEWILIPQSQLK